MHRRNLLILAGCHALAASGGSIIVFIGGIAGGRLAPSPALATMPVALFVAGVATTSAAAALLMGRFGRRAGFVGGAVVGVAGSLAAAAALAAGSFAGLCAATFVIGANLAFVLQYRFAAAESAATEAAGRAVSFVLVAGIVAGFLGPEIVRRTRTLVVTEYAGAFVVLAALYATVALAMLLLQDVRPAATTARAAALPWPALLRRPAFVLSAAAGMVAYGSMSLLMTATPISMHTLDGHSLDAAAIVIQSHVVAMYLPSLFTGAIMDRLGTRRAMAFGLAAIAACVAIGTASHAVAAYWSGLVLLGVGWNFLFVGGTVALARGFPADQRFRAQAANDFLVFGAQAAASLSSGAALYAFGWRTMNLLVLPGLALMTLLLVRVGARAAPGVLAPPRPDEARA